MSVEEMTPPPNRAILFGCGYLGSRVADRLIADRWQVVGVTRSKHRAHILAHRGIIPWIADWTDRRRMRQFPPHQRVLVAVGYKPGSRLSRYETLVGGLRNVLHATDPIADLCYVSSTGVYHQTDGRWVDERSPCNPNREPGRVHLQAEQLLHQFRPGGAWTTMRLAGIYGPDRVPRVMDVLAGRPIASPQQGFLNLIHVEDAASTIMSAWQRGPDTRSRLYVISDGSPVKRETFYQQIALIHNSPSPRFCSPTGNVALRAGTNKRVWNARMRRELLSVLRFPTFRQGLASIAEDTNANRSPVPMQIPKTGH